MRTLLCCCLAVLASAGEPALPGRDPAFLAQIVADSEGGTRPWKTFRTPVEGGSAVVEVVGELTREELREVTFQEFLVWFHADLRAFLIRIGGQPSAEAGAAAMASLRYGGQPLPRTYPLGRAAF
ncbi:MAG: hypothetical protein WCL47_00585 [Holophagaceae bacterium]